MGWKISLKVATRRDRHSGLPKRPITKYYLHNLQLHNLPLRQSYFPPWLALCAAATATYQQLHRSGSREQETLKVMVELYCATILLVATMVYIVLLLYSKNPISRWKKSLLLLSSTLVTMVSLRTSFPKESYRKVGTNDKDCSQSVVSMHSVYYISKSFSKYPANNKIKIGFIQFSDLHSISTLLTIKSEKVKPQY